MRKLLSLVALSPLLAVGAAVTTITPAQAGFLCILEVCTTTYHTYNVPNPTKKGAFISHFDENGVPQSIVTPSDSDTTCTEPVLNGST